MDRKKLKLSPDECGRIMHESWSKTKRVQGFHGPEVMGNDNEAENSHCMHGCHFQVSHESHCVTFENVELCSCGVDDLDNNPMGLQKRCVYFHSDLISWEDLPEAKKDINRSVISSALLDHINAKVESLIAEETKAFREASRWLLHVLSDVGKGGGEPEVGEFEEAANALRKALEEK